MQQRSHRVLRSLVLVLLLIQVLQLLLVSVAAALGVSVVYKSASVQIVILTPALLVTGLAYGLLRRGLHDWACYLLISSLIARSAASIIAYGSIRSAMVMGFAAAVVVAGITLGKKALVTTVLICAATLAALIWAEASGWLATPDFSVDPASWLIHTIILCGIALGVYASRQLLVQALRDQQTELKWREQAEQALRISEDRFSRIFRSSPAAIIVQAVDGMTVLDVNPAFERLYGYSRGEFLGGTDVVLWEKPEIRKSFRRQMAATGRVINFLLDTRAKDGRRLNVLLSSEIEGVGQERIVVSTITDATAETQARQAAHQSAELFSKAFDFSPIHMTITRVSDGEFLAVNAAKNRVQGMTAAEMMGRNSVDVGVWRNNDERQQFIQELRLQSQSLSRDMQMRHKDGSMVDCRIWSVIVEIGGEPCLLNSTINIAEQKRRETLLVDMAQGLSADTSQAFFCSMVRHLGQAIGADLVIVGEMSADQQVTTLAMFQDGQQQPTFSYSLGGTPCDITVRQSALCIYGDGVQAQFPQDQFLVDGGFHAYVGLALHDADDTPIGIVNAMWRKPQPPSQDRDALVQIFASRTTAELMRLRRDREILRLNETLEQRVNERTEQRRATNAELESVGYSVSHDLQSPLRSIEGFNVLLARSLKGRLNEEESRLFDRVRVNVVRMHELIHDLLALAQVSKGKLLLEPVDLSALAQQVVKEQRLSDPQRQVEVTIEPGLSARCDSKFARITLENLIGNAWKYSRGRADAQIGFGLHAAHEDGRNLLFVRDNGAGFNMAYSDNLFKPFHRLHQDAEFEGSGIGLATVHRILERHGGTIRGESTEGAGACFYFSFSPRFSSPAA
ncbi:MAG: PAS domain S-box protein [Polaromonas sp.]|nr:PAS domain S-box protein [Polaromonas sp.]